MNDVAVGLRPEAIPDVITPILGRAREVNDLVGLMDDPACRLVTLTGPGGVGKTRLAIEFAQLVQNRFEGAVAFVSLAPIRDPALVLAAIGRSVGYMGASHVCDEEHLVALLAPHRTLLVLDNLEQVREVAPVLDRILQRCPDLMILATSRTPLGLSEEDIYPLHPLKTPEPDETSAGVIMRNDAVSLFLQRAKAINPHLHPGDTDMPTIGHICRKLDGLPLAIELAASRTNILPPDALLSRLDDRMQLLGGERWGVTERHRTIRDTVAWSYDLLSPVEQALFRRLSVFAGGFPLEAAESILDPGGDQDAADILAMLVEHSLVQEVPLPSGDARFQMFESIRDFGREQLGLLSEEKDAHDAHVTFVMELCEAAESHLIGQRQQSWMERLDAELANIQAAVEWCLAHGCEDRVLGMVSALGQYLPARGLITEGRVWLSQALAATGLTLESRRTKALLVAGNLAQDQRDLDVAQMYFEQARHLAAATNQANREIEALYGLGLVAHERARFDVSLTLHEQGLARARRLGDLRLIAMGVTNLGMAAYFQARLDDAMLLWQESAQLLSELGDIGAETTLLSNIGATAIRLGRLDQAESYLERAVKKQRSLGTRRRLASTLNNLAIVAGERKDFAKAREAFAEVMTMHRQDGNLAGQAVVAHGIANIELDQGHVRDAAFWYVKSLLFMGETEEVPKVLDSVGLLCAICTAHGSHALALEVVAAGERLQRDFGFGIPSEQWQSAMEASRVAAIDALDQDACAAALAAGNALDFAALKRRMPVIGRLIHGPQHVAQELTQEYASPDACQVTHVLTPRELDVLRLLAEGQSTKEISSSLYISTRTVATHVNNILAGLGVSSRTAAVAYALRSGIV